MLVKYTNTWKQIVEILKRSELFLKKSGYKEVQIFSFYLFFILKCVSLNIERFKWYLYQIWKFLLIKDKSRVRIYNLLTSKTKEVKQEKRLGLEWTK